MLISSPLQSDIYFLDVLANVSLFSGPPPPAPSAGSFEQALPHLD